MTFRRYIRLCVVAIPALLLIGFALFKFIIPYSGQTSIVTCEAQSDNFENCRYVGGFESPLYKSIKDKHDVWIDVAIGEPNPHRGHLNWVEATGRTFDQAHIIGAEPFALQPPGARNYMQTLLGKTASVVLGFKEDERSVVSERSALLMCHTLKIKAPGGTFTADCFGQGWSGPVTFEVFGREKDRLEALRGAIAEEIRALEMDYFIYRIVTYPLFIYLFLLVSALVWLVIQATRFVRRG